MHSFQKCLTHIVLRGDLPLFSSPFDSLRSLDDLWDEGRRRNLSSWWRQNRVPVNCRHDRGTSAGMTIRPLTASDFQVCFAEEPEGSQRTCNPSLSWQWC